MKHLVLRFFLLSGAISSLSCASTLDELIGYAVKHSTLIKQNRSQTELAQLAHKHSSVQQYGELNAVGDYTRYNIERTLAPLVPSSIAAGTPITTSKDIFSAGLRYTIPLFTGFAHTRQIEIDQIATQMSQAKMSLGKEQLIYNIRTLYLSVLAQKEILSAQYAFTKAIETLTKQISREVKVGRRAQIDLLKVQADLQDARTKEKIMQSNIETMKASLSALVGKSVKKLKPVKIEVKKPHYQVGSLYAKASQLAKIKVEEMATKKAEKMISKSRASQLPQVNLSAYAGKNYAEDIATGKWDNETLWQVGVNFSYNLIDFGKRDIGVQKAKIAKMQSMFKKEQALLDLKKLLVHAVEKTKEDYATYLGNLSKLRLSKKVQNIEQVRYDNDASTLNDLLLAKAKNWLAKAKVIQSKYDYQKSRYYIDYLMERGTGQ